MNNEKFEELAREIFTYLKGHHPIPQEIHSGLFNIDGTQGEFLNHALEWLHDEGYLRKSGTESKVKWYLTRKAWKENDYLL